MSVSCPEHLKTVYAQGRLIPFVGAGISAGVSWTVNGETRRGPTWAELVDQAAQLIGFDDARLLRARGSDLQILEYYKLRRHNSVGELSNWLSQQMAPSDDELRASKVHTAMAALTLCDLVYTTNYDDFIERAMRLYGRECKSSVSEGQMADVLGARAGVARSVCEVVKFHGDFTAVDRMVLTESDYESRLKLDDARDHRLRSDLLGRAVLFLGYSFRDSNVSYIFRLVNDSLPGTPGSSRRRAYIAVADPSAFERELFESRNIEVIAIDGSRRTEDIESLLRQVCEPGYV